MGKAKQFSHSDNPVSLPVFYMLMSLAVKERHGYDIMKQVAMDSNGKVKLGPGTLYGAIKRMLEDKLITESAASDTRRRYYRLTEKGRDIFNTELSRYSDAVSLARKKKLFVKPVHAEYAPVYV